MYEAGGGGVNTGFARMFGNGLESSHHPKFTKK